MSSRLRCAGVVVATLAVATACSSDNGPKAGPATPDGKCTTGYLTVNGSAVNGTVNGAATSCLFFGAYQATGDSAYSASYGITVTAGTLYQVRDSVAADLNGQASLVLIGTDPADASQRIVLTESEGEAPYDNQDFIWFYAPTSGTYSLRIATESALDTAYSYTVSAVSCPVVATVAATDTIYGDSARALNQTGCRQVYAFFGEMADSTQVNYYLLDYAAGQSRYLNIYSTDFTSGSYAGGYGFNSMDDINQFGSDDWSGYGQAANSYDELKSDSAGVYVLAVGSVPYGGAGTYDLSILPPSLVPPERVPSIRGPRVRSLPGRQARVSPRLRRVHILR